MTKSLYLLDGTITLVLVVRGRGSLFSARWFGLVGAGTAACPLAIGGMIASSGIAVGWVVWSIGAALLSDKSLLSGGFGAGSSVGCRCLQFRL